MGKLQSVANRYSVPLFFILAYTISWSGWLFGNWFMDVYREVLEGAESVLFVKEIPLALRLAVIPAILTPAFGPAISAIILTAIVDGKVGLRDFFGRIVKWRVDFRFYLIVILLPLILRLLPYVIAFLFGGDLPKFSSISFIAALGIFIGYLLRTSGVEELGFRGFAQHNMRKKFGPVRTSIVIGVLWFFWHLPLYLWISGVSQFGKTL